MTKDQWEKVKRIFRVGDTILPVRHGGIVFDGKPGEIIKVDHNCVYLEGKLDSGKKIRTYLGPHELCDINETERGFILFVDKSPYFEYEVIKRKDDDMLMFDNSESAMDEFNNELPGNDVEWRIIQSEHKAGNGEAPFFVYRKHRLRNGKVITQFLLKDGMVSRVALDGWFKDYFEIGMAMIRHEMMIRDGQNSIYSRDDLAYMDQNNKKTV